MNTSRTARHAPSLGQPALFSLAEITGRPEAPELTSYDVILVNISGGKDSQAMLDTVVRQADAAGVRDRVVTVFCDLGDEDEWFGVRTPPARLLALGREVGVPAPVLRVFARVGGDDWWPGARELAAEHAAHYGLRHEVVVRTNKDGETETLSEHIEKRGMWPDSDNRYCTSDQKRGPVLKLMTRLAGEVRERGVPVPRILNCLGLRAQESPARAALAEKGKVCGLNTKATGKGLAKAVMDWLPVYSLTTGDVWAGIERAGTRPHWVYAAGMPRLSCRFCVLASRSALVRAAQLDPEGAKRRAHREKRMGHRFRKDLAMRDIIAAADAAPRGVLAEDWAA